MRAAIMMKTDLLERVQALLVVRGLGVARIAAGVAGGLHAVHEVLPEREAPPTSAAISVAGNHLWVRVSHDIQEEKKQG